jgi:hypothetical protein
MSWLFDPVPDRVTIAPASREGWERLAPTLTERELLMVQAVARYLAATHATTVTGGELAAWANLPITSVRPRLTGAHEKGYLTRTPLARTSRAAGEGRAHGYALALPIEAIERALRVGH